MELRENALTELENEIAKKNAECNRVKKEIEEEKLILEQRKKEFDELRAQFDNAETAEARDRIRLLDVYNSVVGGENKSIDYKSYVNGAVAILSSTHIF